MFDESKYNIPTITASSAASAYTPQLYMKFLFDGIYIVAGRVYCTVSAETMTELCTFSNGEALVNSSYGTASTYASQQVGEALVKSGSLSVRFKSAVSGLWVDVPPFFIKASKIE